MRHVSDQYGPFILALTRAVPVFAEASVLIAGIHQEYADAGADVIETNSFGANRLKLQGHGLADQLEAINRASVRLAREAADDDALVAGSVGPILKSGQVYLENQAEELATTFREQLAVLADEGASLSVAQHDLVADGAQHRHLGLGPGDALLSLRRQTEIGDVAVDRVGYRISVANITLL